MLIEKPLNLVIVILQPNFLETVVVFRNIFWVHLIMLGPKLFIKLVQKLLVILSMLFEETILYIRHQIWDQLPRFQLWELFHDSWFKVFQDFIWSILCFVVGINDIWKLLAVEELFIFDDVRL